MWDLESGRKTTDFIAHNGDVVSISLAPDSNSYVTGSVDKTCRLWDVRENKPKQTFFGHQADVNSVCVRWKANKQKNIKCFFVFNYVTKFVSVPSERFRIWYGI